VIFVAQALACDLLAPSNQVGFAQIKTLYRHFFVGTNS